MKKNYFVMFALALSVFSATAQIELNRGLIGNFPFNGNANDASGIGNNGVVNGATLTADRFGNANSAYSFNGVDNYIRVDNPVGLYNNYYTYSVWVKIRTLPTTYNCSFVMDLANGVPVSGGGFYGESLAINNDYPSILPTTGWSFASACSRSLATRAVSQTETIPAVDAWRNIVVIRDTISLSLSIYENGKLLKSIPTATATVYQEKPNFLIIGGRTELLPGFFLDGIIDDIRFYDRAINKDEINALYNESVCYQSITVTDTLVINVNRATYNPVTYANSIKIYPNPTKDLLTINYGNFDSMQGYTLKLVSSAGQTVFTSQINKQEATVDLSGLAKGLYFVHLIDSQGNTIDVKKIVLQ